MFSFVLDGFPIANTVPRVPCKKIGQSPLESYQ